jgi:hypothetical protein
MVAPDTTNATTVSANPAVPASAPPIAPSSAGNPGGDADWHPRRQAIPATRERFTPNDSECGEENFFGRRPAKKFGVADSKVAGRRKECRRPSVRRGAE